MRFYFNQVGAVYDVDTEGAELASASEARIEAVKFASEVLRDRPELAWKGDEFRVEVTDEKRPRSRIQIRRLSVCCSKHGTGGASLPKVTSIFSRSRSVRI